MNSRLNPQSILKQHMKQQSALQTKAMIIPSVIETTPQGSRAFDIYSKHLKERKIYLIGEIEDYMATNIVAQIHFLANESDRKDIMVYINSPGGGVTAGLSIYDAFKNCGCDIITQVTGQACSMAAFLAASGTKGKRYISPNARMMIHQPLGGFYGQASDIAIHAKEVLDIKHKLNTMLSELTLKPLEQVEKDTDRDNFLSAEESVAYGLVDNVAFLRKVKTNSSI